MQEPFFTIGHSTHSLTEFVDMLKAAEVQFVVDVRAIPKSRRNAQYDIETLPAALARFDLGYEHVPALGGRRPKSKTVARETNAFWQNESFHNFADYALSEPFQVGFAGLREAGHRQRCAVMCAEAVWWRCHRRIIADYLIASAETVLHILAADKIAPAAMTSAARRLPDGSLLSVGCRRRSLIARAATRARSLAHRLRCCAERSRQTTQFPSSSARGAVLPCCRPIFSA